MADQQSAPAVLTNGELQQYLSMYHKELPIVVQVSDQQHLGVLHVSTAVLKPGNVLVLNATAVRTNIGKPTEPVIVPAQ